MLAPTRSEYARAKLPSKASQENMEKWKNEAEERERMIRDANEVQAEMLKIAKQQIEEHKRGEEWRRKDSDDT